MSLYLTILSRASLQNTKRLPRKHIPIDLINENVIFLRTHDVITL